MEITIQNSKTPPYANHKPFADFHLILRRDGDKIVLQVPSPRCFRNWHSLTPVEKDAYNAIVQHVVDTASAAMKKARRTM